VKNILWLIGIEAKKYRLGERILVWAGGWFSLFFKGQLPDTLNRMNEEMPSPEKFVEFIYAKGGWFEKVKEFRETLNKETDRGCALMGAAFLDVKLEEMLSCGFVENKKVLEDLMGKNRPLGTFSSRIDLAYLLGLLGKRLHRDLHLIRDIRNKFGHDPSPITFTHPPIRSKCRELHCPVLDELQKQMPVPPRDRFTHRVCGALGDFQATIEKIEHAEESRDSVLSAQALERAKQIVKHLTKEGPPAGGV
jgi:DNA-binding MltR family transcriptional regulator